MLSILIVNWNTREYLRACLHSLQLACVALEHEIIVVDNASNDGSAQMVRELFPQVNLFALERNLGFAEGNNYAYERAGGRWIWLLNPDTEVLEGTPRQLIEFLQEHPEVGAVASALVDVQTRRPQRSCRTFPAPAALWSEASGLARAYPRSRRFGFYRMGWWRYHDIRPVEQPMAASFLLRREAVTDIYDSDVGGLFDKSFPIFFNDVDLCWRLWQANWPIWYLSNARVLHHGGASTRQARPEMIVESHKALKRFYAKHYQKELAPALYHATLLLIDWSGRLRFCAAKAKSGIKS